MSQLFANNVSTALVGSISDVATTVTVADGSAMPTPTGGDFFLLTLIGLDGNGNENTWEIVKVTARVGNDLTVERGQEGTSAQAWADATRVELRLTAGSIVAREWTAETVSQAEAEAGTSTTRRAWTAQRVRQAIAAWWNGITSAWGRGLVASTDAAAGRTALGLGTAATAGAASTAVAGIVQLNNTLTSTSTSQALTAAQGKALQDGKLGLSGGILTGQLSTSTNTAAMSAAGGSTALQVMGSASYAAMFSLHRSGAYAINVGLDTDNVFRIGGWSDGASTYRIQITSAGACITNSVVFTEYDNGSSGTAKTINWGLRQKHKLTLTGNCTLAFSAPAGAGDFKLRVIQDATGGRSITWPVGTKFFGGAAPTLNTSANSVSLISVYYDGATYWVAGGGYS